MNAMNDFKPQRSPGYTGKRHDDKEPMSREQVGVISFVAGMMLMMLVNLVMGSLI